MIKKKLKIAMAEKGLTQAELARRMGVKQQLVSQLISGKNKARETTLKRIADALDMPLSYFLDGGAEGGIETEKQSGGINFSGQARNEGSINYNETLENYRSKLLLRLDGIEKDLETIKAQNNLIIEKLNKK